MTDRQRRQPGTVAMSSRNRSSTILTIVAPAVAAALLVFALLAPADWSAWTVFGLVTSALWLAWVIWGWPKIDVDDRSVTVRNALFTWQVPLREITEVEGGRKFTLSLTDATRVTAAAISGDGMAVEAWRRTDAATQGGHFVRNADDARLSAGPSSAASHWAKLLRERVRDAPGTAHGTIVRRVNGSIVAGSVVAVGVFLASITLFP